MESFSAAKKRSTIGQSVHLLLVSVFCAACASARDAVNTVLTETAASIARGTVALPPVKSSTPNPPTLSVLTQQAATAHPPTSTVTPTPPPPTETPLPDPFFSRPIFGTEPDQTVRNDEFPSGTREVFVIWTYRHMRQGMIVRRVWTRGGEPWIEIEEEWNFDKYGEGGKVTDISVYDFDLGLQPGQYEIELFIDGVHEIMGRFSIEGYPIEPLPSPGGTRVAMVRYPGSLIVERENGSRRLYAGIAHEFGHIEWFPDARDILYTDVDWNYQGSFYPFGVSLHILDLATGETRQLSPPDDYFRIAAISPDGRYIAGIRGGGYYDACWVDSYLVVMKLDNELNRERDYSISSFSGIIFPTAEDGSVSPGKVEWVDQHKFTANLYGICSYGFQNGRYLFDMDTLQAERKGDLK